MRFYTFSEHFQINPIFRVNYSPQREIAFLKSNALLETKVHGRNSIKGCQAISADKITDLAFLRLSSIGRKMIITAKNHPKKHDSRKFHFISGLPRSGSTLTSALLRQNPRFHAGMSGPVAGLFENVIAQVSAGS